LTDRKSECDFDFDLAAVGVQKSTRSTTELSIEDSHGKLVAEEELAGCEDSVGLKDSVTVRLF
jgi:hypothetical protein